MTITLFTRERREGGIVTVDEDGDTPTAPVDELFSHPRYAEAASSVIAERMASLRRGEMPTEDAAEMDAKRILERLGRIA